MASSDKFCLKWDNFQTNTTSSFGRMRKDQHFSDITLVSGDGDQKIDAHKVILAGSSEFFSKLLKLNSHPHPILYMRGINNVQLNAVVDFIYHGEVDICQEDLDTFLKLAEELELKGLKVSEPEKQQPIQAHKEGKVLQSRSYLPNRSFIKTDTLEESKVNDKEPNTSFDENVIVPADAMNIKTNNKELDQTIRSLMETFGHGKYSCKACGKNTNHSGHMIEHIEGNHIEGATHQCNQCSKIFSSRKSLRSHVFNTHKI